MSDESPETPSGDTDNSMSVVNVGPWAKPAAALIEKFSKHIGDIMRPWLIRREAKAKADAAIIKTEGDLRVAALKQRAKERVELESIRHQENIEKIAVGAFPHLVESARPESINDDWMANFFDRSKNISEPEMQELWSKILAGEGNNPGTYSKRTVNLLSGLERIDALQFSNLLNFVIGAEPVVIATHSFYHDNGVTYQTLQHLDAIGLIQYSVGLQLPLSKTEFPRRFEYFDESILIRSDLKLPWGNASLTKAGRELQTLCAQKKIEGFIDFLKNGPWKNFIYSAP